jgi:hypothetical protein
MPFLECLKLCSEKDDKVETLYETGEVAAISMTKRAAKD